MAQYKPPPRLSGGSVFWIMAFAASYGFLISYVVGTSYGARDHRFLCRLRRASHRMQQGQIEMKMSPTDLFLKAIEGSEGLRMVLALLVLAFIMTFPALSFLIGLGLFVWYLWENNGWFGPSAEVDKRVAQERAAQDGLDAVGFNPETFLPDAEAR